MAQGNWLRDFLGIGEGRGGFGYDPVFFYPERGCTFAQMAPEEKNSVSHRGKALKLFEARLLKRIELAKARDLER